MVHVQGRRPAWHLRPKPGSRLDERHGRHAGPDPGMAAVTQQAPPAALDGTLSTIHAAQVTIEAAAAKASMAGDPIHYMLAAWSEGLGAMAVSVEAVRRPVDAELRRDIIAVYER